MTQPKPVHVKILEGNPSKARLPRKEPCGNRISEIPGPPSFLGQVASEEWRRVAPSLVAMGTLADAADLAALALYCEAFERWRDAENEFRKTGSQLIVSRANGSPMENPILHTSSQAKKEMLEVMGQLGMHAVSRARIGIQYEKAEKRSKLQELMAG